MVLVAIGAITLIMIVVIPQFEQIFLGLLGPGEALPLPTRIVMAISGFIAGWGGIATLVSLIGGAVATHYYYKTPKGHWQIDHRGVPIMLLEIGHHGQCPCLSMRVEIHVNTFA